MKHPLLKFNHNINGLTWMFSIVIKMMNYKRVKYDFAFFM